MTPKQVVLITIGTVAALKVVGFFLGSAARKMSKR